MFICALPGTAGGVSWNRDNVIVSTPTPTVRCGGSPGRGVAPALPAARRGRRGKNLMRPQWIPGGSVPSTSTPKQVIRLASFATAEAVTLLQGSNAH